MLTEALSNRARYGQWYRDTIELSGGRFDSYIAHEMSASIGITERKLLECVTLLKTATPLNAWLLRKQAAYLECRLNYLLACKRRAWNSPDRRVRMVDKGRESAYSECLDTLTLENLKWQSRLPFGPRKRRGM